MIKLIVKLWKEKWILRSIIATLYFNLKFLPIKQAYKLPILLYKPTFIKLKGRIRIESSIVKFGMIQLGRPCVPMYPNNGIIIENYGGEILFMGKCVVGNNSFISIGKRGKLVIGDNFIASTTLRIVCWHKISFMKNIRVGWDCLFMDYDFHSMTKLPSLDHTKGYAEIIIGENNWFCSFCRIYKRTRTPDFCTISSNSILSDNYTALQKYCLIGTKAELIVKAKNIYRNLNDDTIVME